MKNKKYIIAAAMMVMLQTIACNAAEYVREQPVAQKPKRTSYLKDMTDITLGGIMATLAGISGLHAYRLATDTHENTKPGFINDFAKAFMTKNERVNFEKQALARWGVVGGLSTFTFGSGALGLSFIARGIINIARKINT